VITTTRAKHVLLFSEARVDHSGAAAWRFALENVDTGESFSATDVEICECLERLELLAVVRGLEALDQPAKVTLVTKSRYVSRGLKRGLADWRNNAWHWERFGRMVPVRDHDLWRRVDRALSFHQVTVRLWQFAEVTMAEDGETPAPTRAGSRIAAAARKQWRRASHAAASWGDSLRPTGLAAG
jgi:ribonuclease HI